MTTILIVEDGEDQRKLLTHILKFADPSWELLEAPDTSHAQILLASNQVDLIILDHELPKQTGGNWYKDYIRGDPSLRDIPVIFLTALATDTELRHLSNEYNIPLLAKPLEDQDLLKLVFKLTSKKISHKSLGVLIS